MDDIDEIDDFLKQNGGIIGHFTVTEFFGLEEKDVVRWAKEEGLPEVDGVLVFEKRDVKKLLSDIEEEEDDDETDDGDGDDDLEENDSTMAAYEPEDEEE